MNTEDNGSGVPMDHGVSRKDIPPKPVELAAPSVEGVVDGFLAKPLEEPAVSLEGHGNFSRGDILHLYGRWNGEEDRSTHRLVDVKDVVTLRRITLSNNQTTKTSIPMSFFNEPTDRTMTLWGDVVGHAGTIATYATKVIFVGVPLKFDGGDIELVEEESATRTPATGIEPYTYTSDSPDIARIDATTGMVTALKVGQCVIAAIDNRGARGSYQLNVTEKLGIETTDARLKVGGTLARPGRGGKGRLIYACSDTATAEVDRDGTVTGKAIGEATITVTDEIPRALSYQLEVYRGLSLKQNEFELEIGESTLIEPFAGEPFEGEHPYLISAFASDVASVDEDGMATAIKPGNCVVAVADKAEIVTCNVLVSAPLTIASEPASIRMSERMTREVSGGFAPYEYTIAPPHVASVDKTSGLITGLSEGACTVTVTDRRGKSAASPLLVTYSAFTIDQSPAYASEKTYFQREARGGEGALTYTSSSPVNADAQQNGQVYARTAGDATITATDSAGQRVSYDVTVTEPLAFGAGSVPLLLNETILVEPGNGTWPYRSQSNDERFVIVADDTGSITGVGYGTALVRTEDANHRVGQYRVTVTDFRLPSEHLWLACGSKARRPASGAGGSGYYYESADKDVATVGTDGEVTAEGIGTTTIKASINSMTRSYPVTVEEPMAMEPASLTVRTNGFGSSTIRNGTGPFTCDAGMPVANAYVSESTVKVSAMSAGATIITVTDAHGLTAYLDVSVEER